MPTLTVSPVEVFQNEDITLACRSERYAMERLRKDELIYSLQPPEHHLSTGVNGVFEGRALQYDFNYSCVAEAKGITKLSNTITVRPKGTFSRCTFYRPVSQTLFESHFSSTRCRTKCFNVIKQQVYVLHAFQISDFHISE